MVGITQGQTARLNVVNLHEEPNRPACELELMFLDGEGNMLAERGFMIDGGRSAFLDLDADELGGPDTREGRVPIRPVIQALGGPDTKSCDGVIPTLEIFDSETGQTQAILNPAVIKGFNPQPDPPGKEVAPVSR